MPKEVAAALLPAPHAGLAAVGIAPDVGHLAHRADRRVQAVGGITSADGDERLLGVVAEKIAVCGRSPDAGDIRVADVSGLGNAAAPATICRTGGGEAGANILAPCPPTVDP